MLPFDLATFGPVGSALTFGAIGFAFGAVLEMSGFGDTRKLAAQFYLRELTVLKVMFTAIVVAAVLLALATSAGWLDLSRVFINPTFLWPGIVGGLIMGVGFVVGGFCPGTSLVAAATLKVDGLLFVLGALAGVGLFGETVSTYEPWWLSSSMGRFTVPEWLGLPTGVVVVLVVVMALATFWGSEWLERRAAAAGAPEAPAAPGPRQRALRLAGAGGLLALALVVAARGQPTGAQKFAWAPAAAQAQVAERAMFAHPAEVVTLRKDTAVQVTILDLRGEHDFNLFHLAGARRLDPAALDRPEVLKPLLERAPYDVAFLVANGEPLALAAWKALRGHGVGNLYVVEGGVNRWLELYPAADCVAAPAAPGLALAASPGLPADPLAWRFAYATGERLPSAAPELPVSRAFAVPCRSDLASEAAPGGHGHGITWPQHPFTKRVKLQVKAAVKGGCG